MHAVSWCKAQFCHDNIIYARCFLRKERGKGRIDASNSVISWIGDCRAKWLISRDLITEYPIVEIFHSVQGEGARVGYPISLSDLAIVICGVNGVIRILTLMK